MNGIACANPECGHGFVTHMSVGMCASHKCTCQAFVFPSATTWWRVIDTPTQDIVEIWDGHSREKWGARAGTMSMRIPQHGLIKGDEVVVSIYMVRRKKVGANG